MEGDHFPVPACLDGSNLEAVHTASAHIPLAQTLGVAHAPARKAGKDRQELTAICLVNWEDSVSSCSKRAWGTEGKLVGSEKALSWIQDLLKLFLFEKTSLSNFLVLSIPSSFQIILSKSHQPAWCGCLCVTSLRQNTDSKCLRKGSTSQEKGVLTLPIASSPESRIVLRTQ